MGDLQVPNLPGKAQIGIGHNHQRLDSRVGDVAGRCFIQPLNPAHGPLGTGIAELLRCGALRVQLKPGLAGAANQLRRRTPQKNIFSTQLLTHPIQRQTHDGIWNIDQLAGG